MRSVSPKFESEAQMAKLVVAYLAENLWEVYQEVSAGGAVCDIVAKRGSIIWAIECKLGEVCRLLSGKGEISPS